MNFEKKLEYLRFFTKEQNFTLLYDAGDESDRKSELNLIVKFADPEIINELDDSNSRIAIFPFMMELSEEAKFNLSSQFVVGFKINSDEIESAKDIISLVNDNKVSFTKYIDKVINLILDNALEYSSIKFEQALSISNPLTYG